MLKVGLTGGLASGKSFVGQALAGLGCHLIQADELGHLVLLPDGEAYADVAREFGPGILKEDGSIDRKRLAVEVFGEPDRLERLNQLVHPHVFRRERQLIEQFANSDPHGIVVVEAAILIETGNYKAFDRVILVECSEEKQIERAMKRDHLEREEVVARLRRQMPMAQKRKFAEYVISTCGSKEETLRQVGEVYEALRRIEA